MGWAAGWWRVGGLVGWLAGLAGLARLARLARLGSLVSTKRIYHFYKIIGFT